MEKAKLKPVTKHYITCPFCNTDGTEGPGSADHLIQNNTSFGPWYCKSCGKAIYGKTENGDVFVEKSDKTLEESLVLLRLDPQQQSIFLIVKGRIFDGKLDEDSDQYLYEQHTCPTNFLGDVEVVIIGEDNDSHGLFEYVTTIRKSKDLEVWKLNTEELANLFKHKPLVQIPNEV